MSISSNLNNNINNSITSNNSNANHNSSAPGSNNQFILNEITNIIQTFEVSFRRMSLFTCLISQRWEFIEEKK